MPNHNLQVGVSPDYLNFLQAQKDDVFKVGTAMLAGPCLRHLPLPLPSLEASKVAALPPPPLEGPPRLS